MSVTVGSECSRKEDSWKLLYPSANRPAIENVFESSEHTRGDSHALGVRSGGDVRGCRGGSRRRAADEGASVPRAAAGRDGNRLPDEGRQAATRGGVVEVRQAGHASERRAVRGLGEAEGRYGYSRGREAHGETRSDARPEDR